MIEDIGAARTGRINPGIIATGLGVLIFGTALAQSPESLNVDVGECIALESPEERFACYESSVDSARKESDSVTPPPERESRRDPARETRPTDVAGRSAERSRSDIISSEEASRPDEIVGTIETLQARLPNAYMITLDNGQVWRQTNPKFYPLRPGQTVRLRSTAWGTSYRLTTDERGGFIQVERVR
jgi:hypothetical protein